MFMFPGGGAQYAGMGASCTSEEPVYRAVDRRLRRTRCEPPTASICAAALYPATATSTPPVRRLEAPSLALPALYATEVRDGGACSSRGASRRRR